MATFCSVVNWRRERFDFDMSGDDAVVGARGHVEAGGRLECLEHSLAWVRVGVVRVFAAGQRPQE